MSHNVATLTGLVTSDPASSAGSIVERDGNADILARDFLASRCLRAGGGLFLHGIAKSANFAVDDLASLYIVDTTSGNVTATLPAVASNTDKVVGFKKIVAANTLTLDGAGSETIDGSTTKDMTTQYSLRVLYCDGSAWHIIASI